MTRTEEKTAPPRPKINQEVTHLKERLQIEDGHERLTMKEEKAQKETEDDRERGVEEIASLRAREETEEDQETANQKVLRATENDIRQKEREKENLLKGDETAPEEKGRKALVPEETGGRALAPKETGEKVLVPEGEERIARETEEDQGTAHQKVLGATENDQETIRQKEKETENDQENKETKKHKSREITRMQVNME